MDSRGAEKPPNQIPKSRLPSRSWDTLIKSTKFSQFPKIEDVINKLTTPLCRVDLKDSALYLSLVT